MGGFPFTTVELLSVEPLLSFPFMSTSDDMVSLPVSSSCDISRTMAEKSPPAYQTTLQIVLQSAGDVASFSRVNPSAMADRHPTPTPTPRALPPPTHLRRNLLDAAIFSER